MKISMGIKLGILLGIINCIVWYAVAVNLGFYEIKVYYIRNFVTYIRNFSLCLSEEKKQ